MNANNGTITFWLLMAAIFLLILVSAGLGLQNRAYEIQNRTLIIQNDSLMGANIELSKLIYSPVTAKKDSSLTSSN